MLLIPVSQVANQYHCLTQGHAVNNPGIVSLRRPCPISPQANDRAGILCDVTRTLDASDQDDEGLHITVDPPQLCKTITLLSVLCQYVNELT